MGKEDVMYARAHTRRAEYCSAVKKNWNNAICSNMDGPRVYHILSDNLIPQITFTFLKT